MVAESVYIVEFACSPCMYFLNVLQLPIVVQLIGDSKLTISVSVNGCDRLAALHELPVYHRPKDSWDWLQNPHNLC